MNRKSIKMTDKIKKMTDKKNIYEMTKKLVKQFKTCS